MTDEASSQPMPTDPAGGPHKPTHPHHSQSSAGTPKSPITEYFPLILGGILLLAVLVSFLFILPALNKGPVVALATPAPSLNATPLPVPKLYSISLVVNNCPECSNSLGEVSSLEQNGADVNNTNVNYNSTKGQELIAKYGVKKVPAFIVTGEINAPQVKSALLAMGNLTSDAIVAQDPAPVYVDLSTGQKIGLINLMYIPTKECRGCTDFAPLIDEMKQAGMAIQNEALLEENSTDAQKLIATYNITKLPALVLSKDASAYTSFADAWTQIGSIEKDGSFVLRQNAAPYYDLVNKTVYGAVNITYLSDKTCMQCYNASIHNSVLERVGVFLKNKFYADVNDANGKALVAKYNVTLVPTMILSQEFKAYSAFIDKIWGQVGTIETDGSYVFRNMQALGNVTYKNLATGEILGPGIVVAPTPVANASSPTPLANATVTPTANATANATVTPQASVTVAASPSPSVAPSTSPTSVPTTAPSTSPTSNPSATTKPSVTPSPAPTAAPTIVG